MTSPAALLAAQAVRWADRPLFVLPEAVADLWGAARTHWTYAEAAAAVADLRAAYAAAGYGVGHRVALMLENRPEHFLHWLALNGLGASVVPLNPDATADELRYVLGHSGAGLTVTLASRLAQVAGLGVPAVVAGDAPPPAGAPSGARPGECALIYTSGTTGRPKGCILPDGYFLRWGDWYAAQPAPIALRPGRDRLLTPLPAFHVNAMANSFMGMLATGGAQVIVDRFHPRTWWATAVETGATGFHYLGVMPAILLSLPDGPHDRAHGLRFGFGGGVHPDHHAAFEARFGVPLCEGWAMTESGGACLIAAVAAPRHVGTRCIGRPGPHMRARVVDDTGAEAETGELQVRAAGNDPAAGLFAGYLDDPAATAAVWADGWLRTGDVVRRGPDGSLHFVERLKNIIRRSGENIAALEVEGALTTHSQVRAVAVVPADDPLRGEEVMAIVVPAPGADEAALAAALLAHAAERLAWYKVPGIVVFRDALPVTATQKVRKADLGALARDPLADPRAHDLRGPKAALRRPTTDPGPRARPRHPGEPDDAQHDRRGP
jgi:acyl-CoA synthetase (AMP-forming)/AMP-acid ligase II